MEFTNDFTVPTGIEETWSVLTDVPRIAPCLPGATVEPLGNDAYSGTVAVKVGPIKASYSGTATFRELNQEARHMVLDAQGQEKSGKGSASAAVAVTLHSEDSDKTQVQVHTDLQVTGKLAQFGRSAMADVGARLIAQFADNLENLLAPVESTPPTAAAMTPAGSEQEGQAATAASVPSVRIASSDAGSTATASPASGLAQSASANSTQDLDALALVAPLVKRALPSAGAFVLGVTVTWLIGRLRKTAPGEVSPVPVRYVVPYGYGPS